MEGLLLILQKGSYSTRTFQAFKQLVHDPLCGLDNIQGCKWGATVKSNSCQAKVFFFFLFFFLFKWSLTVMVDARSHEPFQVSERRPAGSVHVLTQWEHYSLKSLDCDESSQQFRGYNLSLCRWKNVQAPAETKKKNDLITDLASVSAPKKKKKKPSYLCLFIFMLWLLICDRKNIYIWYYLFEIIPILLYTISFISIFISTIYSKLGQSILVPEDTKQIHLSLYLTLKSTRTITIRENPFIHQLGSFCELFHGYSILK